MPKVVNVGARVSRLAARISGFVVALAMAPAVHAATCESLATLTLPQATVDSAQLVAAGSFTQPGGRAGRGGNAFGNLPAFCRITLTAKPSSDSDIKIEVWLPASAQGSGATGSAGAAGSAWNGKYLAVGNGAWTGNI